MINQHFFRVLILCSFFFLPHDSFAEGTGTVCLGPNNMLVPYTPNEYVTLTIGNSEHIDFMSQTDKPRVVINGLDLNKVYSVKVYYRDKVTHSWKLDFRKYKSTLVQIWRGPGVWHMQDSCKSECGRVVKCK